MRVRNVAKVVAHCLRHPQDSLQLVQETHRSGAARTATQNAHQSYLNLLNEARRPNPARAARQASGLADQFAASFPPLAADQPRTGVVGNPLWDYAERQQVGPGIIKWAQYFEIYHRHFQKFVGRPVHIVEVGIYSGGSLRMWHDYFGPQCQITGIDIEPACQTYETTNTRVVIGDQGDRKFWQRFRDTNPPIDILIDDGGHEPEQQRVTLEEVLPYLNPGGVFLCEDVHGRDNPFARYAHLLALHLHHPAMKQVRPEGLDVVAPSIPWQQAIHSAHIYPFAIVFERNEQPFNGFRSYARGSQWQPFFAGRS